MLRNHSQEKVYLITSASRLESSKAKRFQKSGIELLACPTLKSGLFDFKKLMKTLGQLSLTSILVEGGPTVWTELMRQKYFQEIVLFLAPKFLGSDAKSSIGPLQLKNLPTNFDLPLREIKKLDEDVMLRYF